MALDEVLLEAAAAAERPCWRFYQWSEPTLSIGYFQAADERHSHPASAACPVVRRLTGGGTILHDQELTYSLTVPAAHDLAKGRDRLYRRVHTALVDALREAFSVETTLCAGQPATRAEPFLCFQRRSLGDVLCGPWKIAGSAQRRRRGAVLQHGSLLLRRSPHAPELPGLEDLVGRSIPLDVLRSAWLAHLATGLDLTFQSDSLSDEERQRAEQLETVRYDQPTWSRPGR